MQTSIQIIEEIEFIAARLQRLFLNLPGPGETISKEQQETIDKARKGLEEWRDRELGELGKAFNVVN